MNRAALISTIEAGLRPRFRFFWQPPLDPEAPPSLELFSQWAETPFDKGGVRYPTAEHWMMAEKARLFGDDATREKIIAAAHPRTTRSLGRTVTPFDEDTWRANRVEIVTAGNREKFGQNTTLRALLLDTGDDVLVEASPSDRIWGVGLREGDARARDPRHWRGTNLLGFALMDVREWLRQR